MHYWNNQFGNLQQIAIPKNIYLLFFDHLSIWEKYCVFYDQEEGVFWVVQTTSILYRAFMLLFGMIITLLYGSFLLTMSIISLDIFHQYFWDNLKQDIEEYNQEVKELLFPEKYGQYYSRWINKNAGNKYTTLKMYLDK